MGALPSHSGALISAPWLWRSYKEGQGWGLCCCPPPPPLSRDNFPQQPPSHENWPTLEQGVSIYGLKKENCPTAEIGSASRVCNQQLPFQCPWLFSLCFGVGKEDLFCLLFGIIYFILFFFFFFPQFPPSSFLFF